MRPPWYCQNRALGERYRVMTHLSENKGGLQESEFNVVAGDSTVEVEITPRGDIAIQQTTGVRSTGVPYKVTIPPHHVYQAQADSVHDDLTGTLIESTNGQKFSVYSGNTWASITCRTGGGNADPLLECMFPTKTWGSNYFTIPTPTVELDSIRIVADQDTTQVFKDGVLVATLNGGEFYGDTIQSIHQYTSSKPTLAAQFLYTGSPSSCVKNSITDPSMIILNATEQMYLDSISFFAVDTSLLSNHYVMILTRTSDTSWIYYDSIKQTNFTPFTQDVSYSYKIKKIATAGYHRLETDSGCGFIAYSMGIGSAISYGYATGASLIDLSASFSFKNSINGSDTICMDTSLSRTDSVQFTSIIKGNPLGYSWDFGDGTTSTLQNPKHAYSRSDNFIVTLMVRYGCGTDTLIDTVVVPPPPVIDLGPDTVLCEGDTLRFTANTREFVAVWNTGSTDSSLEITTAGIYHVTVSNYCGWDRDTVKVDIRPIPTVSLPADTVLCLGDSFRLHVPIDSITTLKWEDGSSDTVRMIGSKGLYWADVSSKCGSNRDSINIGQQDVASIDAGGLIISCDQDTVRLGGNPTGPPKSKYAWSSPEALDNPSIANPTSFYTLNRVYHLIVVDSNGCESIDSATVKRFSLSAEAEAVDCSKDSVQLNIVKIDGTTPYTYFWTPNYKISSQTIRNPTVSPDSSVTYTVKVTDSVGCEDSVRVQVPITNPVKAQFDVIIQASCENAIANTNNQSINASIFKWYVNDAFAGNDFNLRIPLEFGTSKKITLFATNVDSCSDSSSVVKDVLVFEDYFNEKIPNVFTPNGDGQNDLFDVQLGQRLETCSNIRIYNRWGELMFESVGNSHKWDGRTFAGEECKSGVYFFVLDVNGSVYKGSVTLLR